MFISLKVFLIACSGILNFVSRIFIDGMCDVALAHAVITISGSIFQPLFVRLLSRPIDGFAWYGNPLTHIRSGLNLAF